MQTGVKDFFRSYISREIMLWLSTLTTKFGRINRFKENLAYNLAQCKKTNQGKLRTYALFKNVFQKEKYLSVIKDTDIRKCFMSFRISSHKLEIERGRYKKKTPC